ncbi:MAG: Ig-like domain-containing protein [Planctomycetia bacterium]|nr:Ig-like domain-containing protein [Planctomycetia bacterium]
MYFSIFKLNQIRSTSLIGLTLFAIFFGCSQAPEGVPRRFATTVTVTDAGQPIEDALVLFCPRNNEGILIISGKSNSNGVATITTSRGSWIGKGAPEGEYIVTVTKEVEIPEWKTPAEIAQMTPPEAEKYNREKTEKRNALPRIIPQPLTSTETSPCSLTVTSGSNMMEIDVSQYKDKK